MKKNIGINAIIAVSFAAIVGAIRYIWLIMITPSGTYHGIEGLINDFNQYYRYAWVSDWLATIAMVIPIAFFIGATFIDYLTKRESL